MKYLIANGNWYVHLIKKHGWNLLDRDCDYKYSSDEATKFTYTSAAEYLQKMPNKDGWNIRSISNTRKSCVITTCYLFVANSDGDITNHPKNALLFDSTAEAQNFLIMHPRIFANPKILSENLKPVVISATSEKKGDDRVVFSRHTRIEVYNKNRGICGICGGPVSSTNFTVDHIVPLSRGGKNEPSNYQLACEKCNKLKSNYKDDEFARGITNILANQLKKEENSDLADVLIRSIVRGKINSMMRGTVYERF